MTFTIAGNYLFTTVCANMTLLKAETESQSYLFLIHNFFSEWMSECIDTILT